ncbi:prephenate dehydrogenase [Halovivax ruber XH-70]|uniref:Prephenate dehydrogenase n=1 Tax=Halovivax ruber (strain DSM 18193 / JCM 13892 / XH-70) TaxID=797302 RepID=L0IB59_HALRX|nr:prephenate dehydrogenase/arogenate dehydrogenase family protein [Halovivax ruber]AGB15476.1 prephenate dehydrogenase [Halovivax ruber XH-70]
MDVLVVGAGAMGRWIADVLDAEVAVADVDEAVARETAAAVGGRVAPLDPVTGPAADGEADGDADGASAEFDVVCLAVPMALVEEAVAAHADRARGVLVDVTGVMEPALEAMAGHAPDLEHCSLHPLFAPERAPGSIAVVAENRGPLTAAILADLEAAGNDLVETTAAEHDAAMGSVQAATHAAVLSFGLAAERVPSTFETPVYAALREQVERLAGGTPRVYADIQARFDGSTDVAAAAERVASADHDELEAIVAELGDRWADGGGDGA